MTVKFTRLSISVHVWEYMKLELAKSSYAVDALTENSSLSDFESSDSTGKQVSELVSQSTV